MRTTIALFLLAACGLALPASADQWSKSYPVSGKPDVWVSTGDGSVKIDVWDESRIEARIDTVGYEINKDFRLEESQSGNRVRIETKFPDTQWGLHASRRSLMVTLKVPRESNLDIHTGDGSLTVVGATGDLRLRSGDGAIDAKGIGGRLTASSGDGRVSVEGRFDLLNLHTGDGPVEAAARAGSTAAESWSMTTGDGSVTLRLPDEFKADVDAHTGDGSITVDLPLTVTGTIERSHVRGTLNGGGGSVTVRTGDGSIHLGRS
jgi:DUF4097 and DUF4098 domain-containing protein YvlB